MVKTLVSVTHTNKAYSFAMAIVTLAYIIYVICKNSSHRILSGEVTNAVSSTSSTKRIALTR